ncbi:MAG TPA: hypothetical protein VM901_10800 [Bdellovibrionota bacterium]|jgi:hypothetical protein|nr:hypothetical protein [Bdellovibrionota bacterium]
MNFLSKTLILSILVGNLAQANRKGNGGIDVVTKDGEQIPVELYLEDRTERVEVCELAGEKTGVGEAREWRALLNHIVAELFKKNPAAAITLHQALTKDTQFNVLTLDAGDAIYYTDDDGSVIQAAKVNGAIRLTDSPKVYLLRSAWENYWNKREEATPYRKMLARVLHEALLKYYSPEIDKKVGKALLGEAVVEILRLAGVVKTKDAAAPENFAKMTPQEISVALGKYGLVPANRPGLSKHAFSFSIEGEAKGDGTDTIENERIDVENFRNYHSINYSDQERVIANVGERDKWMDEIGRENLFASSMVPFSASQQRLGKYGLEFYHSDSQEFRDLEKVVKSGRIYSVMSHNSAFQQYFRHAVPASFTEALEFFSQAPVVCP